jgi:hypothetical protein
MDTRVHLRKVYVIKLHARSWKTSREEGAFDMDTLGIKDKVRSAGLLKFYKKDQSDCSPEERKIDKKMVVTMVPAKATVPQHYTCKIPWKNGKEPDLKNNIEQILKRQHQTCYSGYLEKKGTSIEEIDKYFQDMLDKGYIKDPEDIKRAISQGICWFPVEHKNHDTTKVRVVFDAASSNREGKSVNSEVEKTRNRLNYLFRILLRFRQYEFALQADISEMFLRICLEPEDGNFTDFIGTEKFGNLLVLHLEFVVAPMSVKKSLLLMPIPSKISTQPGLVVREEDSRP